MHRAHRGAAYLCSWCEWHNPEPGLLDPGTWVWTSALLLLCSLGTCYLWVSLLCWKPGSTIWCSWHRAFPGHSLGRHVVSHWGSGSVFASTSAVGRLVQPHCLWRFFLIPRLGKFQNPLQCSRDSNVTLVKFPYAIWKLSVVHVENEMVGPEQGFSNLCVHGISNWQVVWGSASQTDQRQAAQLKRGLLPIPLLPNLFLAHCS